MRSCWSGQRKISAASCMLCTVLVILIARLSRISLVWVIEIHCHVCLDAHNFLIIVQVLHWMFGDEAFEEKRCSRREICQCFSWIWPWTIPFCCGIDLQYAPVYIYFFLLFSDLCTFCLASFVLYGIGHYLPPHTCDVFGQIMGWPHMILELALGILVLQLQM